MHILDAYPAHLARLFALQPLAVESAGAPAVRIYLLPAFSPEAMVSLVAAPRRARLEVRSLDRSAWTHLHKVREKTSPDAGGELVEPTFVSEEVAVHPGVAASLVVQMAAARVRTNRTSAGHDGLTVQGELSDDVGVVKFERWCPTRDGDALEQAIVDFVELAQRSVRADWARAALRMVAPYKR